MCDMVGIHANIRRTANAGACLNHSSSESPPLGLSRPSLSSRIHYTSTRFRVRCNLESNPGHANVRAREPTRRVQCNGLGAAETLPARRRRSVEELQAKFGQPGVKFVEAAGFTIVEMKLKEGSSARVVLQSAFVASFKSRMWHGGVEELLRTLVVPGEDDSQRPTPAGGVALRVWESGAGSQSNLLASTKCWEIENARSDPGEFVQIALSTTCKGATAGHSLQFKYVMTLTNDSLICAVIATNIGTSAVSIHGSFRTNLAVNFVDGAYAIGLQGCKYLPTMPPNLAPTPRRLDGGEPSVDDTNAEGMLSKLQRFVGFKNEERRNDASVGLQRVEKEEMVRMKGGFSRTYIEAPDCVSLLDRGKRRTSNFCNSGFEEIQLSNPGEESGLEDWDSFVCIELSRSNRPVNLQPGEEWRAAQKLENPSK
ncbi:protein NDH-DEPENDENT CYCLIC ELECTRON FLOW 5 [Physcomitrium patens]